MTTPILDFDLPTALSAGSPPELRGLTRDRVRMMVCDAQSGQLVHTRFDRILDHLRPGDALVVNVSKTMPAALDATTVNGAKVVVHLSVPLPDGLWTVEVRTPAGHGTLPGPSLEPQTLKLGRGGEVRLLARHLRSPRIWVACIDLPGRVEDYLEMHGRPIRYGPEAQQIPISAYQTVFANEPGSSEMPSAGRPFTNELVVRLMAKGVSVLPIVLHCGVASFEASETPTEERYRVPQASATIANALREAGGRTIAVGTTVVRALETVRGDDGSLNAGQGYTDLVIAPGANVESVDGLLTGWHEPGASHLAIVEGVAGRRNTENMYREAVASGYLWHEFGDVCLILR